MNYRNDLRNIAINFMSTMVRLNLWMAIETK
jgi:hypothetical protein